MRDRCDVCRKYRKVSMNPIGYDLCKECDAIVDSAMRFGAAAQKVASNMTAQSIAEPVDPPRPSPAFGHVCSQLDLEAGT